MFEYRSLYRHARARTNGYAVLTSSPTRHVRAQSGPQSGAAGRVSKAPTRDAPAREGLTRGPVGLGRRALAKEPVAKRPVAKGALGGRALGRSRANAAVRRRRALGALSLALAVPVVLGALTGSAAAWWVVVALLPVVCAYLAVVFRARRVLAEREINLAFLGTAGRAEPGLEGMFSTGHGLAMEDRGAVSAGCWR